MILKYLHEKIHNLNMLLFNFSIKMSQNSSHQTSHFFVIAAPKYCLIWLACLEVGVIINFLESNIKLILFLPKSTHKQLFQLSKDLGN